MVERQIQEHDRRAESYKDTLVRKMATMLAEERKRTDRLLVQYNLLRNRLSSMKQDSQENEPEPAKKATPAVPISQRERARAEDNPGLGYSQRFWNSFRKIFFP